MHLRHRQPIKFLTTLPPVRTFVRKLSQLFQKLLQEGLLVSFKSPTSNMYMQNHEYTIIRPYNKVILYRFLEQLDLLLLNQGIKCKFQHFLCLTTPDILKGHVMTNLGIAIVRITDLNVTNIIRPSGRNVHDLKYLVDPDHDQSCIDQSQYGKTNKKIKPVPSAPFPGPVNNSTAWQTFQPRSKVKMFWLYTDNGIFNNPPSIVNLLSACTYMFLGDKLRLTLMTKSGLNSTGSIIHLIGNIPNCLSDHTAAYVSSNAALGKYQYYYRNHSNQRTVCLYNTRQ